MDDRALAALADAARRILPDRRLTAMRPWPGSRTNRLFRLTFSAGPDAALRVYAGGAAALRAEVDLHRILAGRIPVPAVRAAAADDAPAFAIFDWVEGTLLGDLRRAGDPAALASAGRSIGTTLARLAEFRPVQPGEPATARDVLAAVAGLERDGALAPALAGGVRRIVRDRRAALDAGDADAVLVHGNASARNIILDGPAGRLAVAALIDWERSRTGSALIDLGSVLRDERPGRPGLEPHLSHAYQEAGGRLPAGWRDLARLSDLIDILRGLARPDLPHDARAELHAIVAATVEAG